MEIDSLPAEVSPSALLMQENLPLALRKSLLPALDLLMDQGTLEGLRQAGSWVRGTAAARSEVDLLVVGLEECSLPVHPVVVRWKKDAIPWLEGCRFPWAGREPATTNGFG